MVTTRTAYRSPSRSTPPPVEQRYAAIGQPDRATGNLFYDLQRNQGRKISSRFVTKS
jgi:hypothetical protein